MWKIFLALSAVILAFCLGCVAVAATRLDTRSADLGDYSRGSTSTTSSPTPPESTPKTAGGGGKGVGSGSTSGGSSDGHPIGGGKNDGDQLAGGRNNGGQTNSVNSGQGGQSGTGNDGGSGIGTEVSCPTQATVGAWNKRADDANHRADGLVDFHALHVIDREVETYLPSDIKAAEEVILAEDIAQQGDAIGPGVDVQLDGAANAAAAKVAHWVGANCPVLLGTFVSPKP